VSPSKVQREKPTYIMVPRRLMYTWVASFVCMVIMTGLSVEYASYTDNRSNHRWCGLVKLFNEAYKENPSPTPLGKNIASEMHRIYKEFHC
jgi:hypothetical protein